MRTSASNVMGLLERFSRLLRVVHGRQDKLQHALHKVSGDMQGGGGGGYHHPYKRKIAGKGKIVYLFLFLFSHKLLLFKEKAEHI